MSDNSFHDHLDACERCRNYPFALCTDGERILRSFAAYLGTSRQAGDWKPSVEQPLRGVESTHKKNGHAPHVTAENARMLALKLRDHEDEPARACSLLLAYIDRAERIESIASEIVDAEKNGSQAAEVVKGIELLEHVIRGKLCCGDG